MSWQWHVMPGTCPHHDSNVFCAWCHGYDSDMSWLCQNRNTCHYHDISSPQYAMIYHYHDSNISWSYHCRDMLWPWQCHRNRCHSNHRDMSWQCHNSNTCNYHDMSLPWHYNMHASDIHFWTKKILFGHQASCIITKWQCFALQLSGTYSVGIGNIAFITYVTSLKMMLLSLCP